MKILYEACFEGAGRGGLDEESGEGPAAGDGARRGVVSRADAGMHRPSDAEHALRLIASQLRGMRHLNADTGAQVLNPQTHLPASCGACAWAPTRLQQSETSRPYFKTLSLIMINRQIIVQNTGAAHISDLAVVHWLEADKA